MRTHSEHEDRLYETCKCYYSFVDENMEDYYEWDYGILRIDALDGGSYLWNSFEKSIRYYPPGPFDIHDKKMKRIEFATRFRALLYRSGKSVDEVAEMASLTKAMIYRYIGGTSEPTVGTLRTLAKVLNCDISEFFRDVREFDFRS